MLISNREELAESGEGGQNPDTLSHLVHSDIPATFLFPENRVNTRFSSTLSLYSYTLLYKQVYSTIGSSAPSSTEYGVQKRGQAGPIRRPLFIERQIMHALAAN